MRFFFALLAVAFVNVARAQTFVVPNANATAAGTGTFLGPFANSARTYQLLIHSDQLTGFVGQNLTGLTWRTTAAATVAWPAATTTYADYDIFLSTSVAPADRSLTFANNVVGVQTQVRDGALTIDPNSFPVTGTPHEFGTNIEIAPWTYAGGHLLVELRHGTSNGTSLSVDAVTTSSTGYGSQFSACWTGSATGTSGSQGNFSVVQFTATPVPEPGAMISLGSLALFAVRCRKSWQRSSVHVDRDSPCGLRNMVASLKHISLDNNRCPSCDIR